MESSVSCSSCSNSKYIVIRLRLKATSYGKRSLLPLLPSIILIMSATNSISASELAEQNAEDTYEQYEKYFHAGSGGKQRSKVEVAINSQRYDAGGDTRKIVTAMVNNEKNRQHAHK
ncbi:unnamed protein product [Adineta ricciae]|uniref:Uncharacterized protein n=1 Tax=Adineta ricciae TaxID=249248 RepID=A0A813N891_ADIRI|nr:unnamed protein product [Adineta ricciae]CAF0790785.1 unnamed protein product [Adineta ricciae]